MFERVKLLFCIACLFVSSAQSDTSKTFPALLKINKNFSDPLYIKLSEEQGFASCIANHDNKLYMPIYLFSGGIKLYICKLDGTLLTSTLLEDLILGLC